VHLKVTAKSPRPLWICRKNDKGVCTREKIAPDRGRLFSFWLPLNPFLELNRDKRADAVQFRKGSPGSYQVHGVFGPEKRAAGRSLKRADENA
jgi:hypothetical protein